MAFSYKTPGAYIEEIVKLPPSVAQVETAIPIFIGVTQFATELSTGDLQDTPKKINSFADYEFYFGGPDKAKAKVLVKSSLPSSAELAASYYNNMYYAVKHYFDNGGGPVYIQSIGLYNRTDVDANKYKDALLKLDTVDEVTLIVVPDMGPLSIAQAYDVYNAAMLRANALQDKFVIADVRNELTGTKIDATKSKSNFRNAISNTTDNIKYASAYFPDLETTYNYNFDNAQITLDFEESAIVASPAANRNAAFFLKGTEYNTVKSMHLISQVSEYLNDAFFQNISVEAASAVTSDIKRKVDSVLANFELADQTLINTHVKDLNTQLLADSEVAKAANNSSFNLSVATAKTSLRTKLETRVKAIFDGMEPGVIADLKTNKSVTDTNYGTLKNTFLSKISGFFNSLFDAKIKEAFNTIMVDLPPSPAIAGVYAYVDRTRGVWKAPANVSLNAVTKPKVLLSDLEQEDFNVDAENGKSINCIRQFVGRGNVVWGARTLAGNNNEWRYTNVRRFFNMVEESCQNASRQFVFEPNDANTWVRVKGMIDNYLTNLWRQGALQGAKPEHAFYTAVGLNQTMTQDDILNGLMIVEIGLAVVRPAEFIVLRFSHKLAVS